MAVLAVWLSSRARSSLSTTLTVLSLLCLFLAILYSAFLVYSYRRHSYILHDLIIKQFDHVYPGLALMAGIMVLKTPVCWRLAGNVTNQPTNDSVKRSLFVLTVFILLFGLIEFWCVCSLPTVKQALLSVIDPRLRHGVSLYMENAAWEAAIDRIQANLKCCGARSHSDWLTKAWIPLSALPPDPALYAKLAQPNGKVLVPVVPTSCCVDASDASCGHRGWLAGNGTRSAQGRSPDSAAAVHQAGCAPAIAALVTRDMMLLQAFILAVVFMQLANLLCLRYLYSSTINSLLLGTPRGAAPGYLFSWGTTCLRIPSSQKYEEEEALLGSKPKKQRWKCKRKFCGKSNKSKTSNKQNHSDEELSDTSTTTTRRKRMINSPLFSKLKDKLKKKKNKDKAELKSLKTKDTDEEISDQEEEESEFIEKNEKAPRRRSKGRSLEMLSHNADNVNGPRGVSFNQSPKLEVFKMGTTQNTPFTEKMSSKENKSMLKIDNRDELYNRPSERKIAKEPNTVRKSPSKEIGSENDQDFRKTRDLFENAKRGYKIPHKQTVALPRDLIDFEGPSFANKRKKTSATSEESEEDSSLVLRNYVLPKANNNCQYTV